MKSPVFLLFLALGLLPFISVHSSFLHKIKKLYTAATHSSIHPPTSNFRLNVTVKPIHYSLRMRPIIDDGYKNLPPRYTVPSSVSIDVESISNKSCNFITLHQRNLTIDLASVRVTNLKTGAHFTVTNQTFEPTWDLYTIHLKESYKFGDTLQIYVKFSANISLKEESGIYLGHYVDPDTKEKHFWATTKMEPYHARKVFPLFDEPGLKATFSVTVGRVEGKYHSLSNMEVMRVERDHEHRGWVWDHYPESVIMSPYIFCVIVSDFKNETIHVAGFDRSISTWAPPSDIKAGGGIYPTTVAAKLLDFYEKRFKMDYPLRKLDAVALTQFGPGAMENFGIPTYKHEFLIWIPGENTEAQRRKTTQVISHEITHQWYGNIITCGWWSDLWLNEGFARYFQFLGMNHTIPEFLVEDAIVSDVVQLAMAYDQTNSTHPMRNLAENGTEISAVFDRISYERGASVIRMIEGFLGRDIFEVGVVEIYLASMQWKVVYQEDLFRSLQESVQDHNATHLLPNNLTVEDIMTEWTHKTGYPVVRVTAVDKHTISLSQEKFSVNETTTGAPGHWWIPVKIMTPKSSKSHCPDIWISNNVSVLTYSRDNINTDELVMVNPDAVGYFRVLYDYKLMRLIVRQLDVDHKLISSSSRSQLIDDYFNLVSGGYVKIETAFELTKYLGKESASNVWVAALAHLKEVYGRLSNHEQALSSFKKYVVPRLEGALSIIGTRQLPDERGINVTLRVELMDLACKLGSVVCENQAAELMDQWMRNPGVNPFPVDLRPLFYCKVVSKSLSMDTWNFFLEKFYEAKRPAQATPFITALSCTKNATALVHLLEMSVNASSSFKNHTEHVLMKVAENAKGRSVIFDFAKREFIKKNINDRDLTIVVYMMSGYWQRVEDLEELEKFLRDNAKALKNMKSTLDITPGFVRMNIDWLKKYEERIRTWFDANI